MLFVQFQTFFVVLLAFVGFAGVLNVEARPTRGTVLSRRLTPEERDLSNADRLARGLPPSAPVLRRYLPGREEELPTRSFAAKRGGSSGLPTVYTGRIEVRDVDTAQLFGYIRNALGGPTSLDLYGTQGGDLTFEITTSSGNYGPLDVRALAPQWSGSPYVGGAGQGSLSPGSAGFLSFNYVPQTAPGALPTTSGASAIWYFNPQTFEITAQWINSDGSKPQTILGFDTRVNRLLLLGDLTWYNNHTTFSTRPVTFHLVH